MSVGETVVYVGGFLLYVGGVSAALLVAQRMLSDKLR